jgi:uncharacterized repeat protein (TIGR01451 family)
MASGSIVTLNLTIRVAPGMAGSTLGMTTSITTSSVFNPPAGDSVSTSIGISSGADIAVTETLSPTSGALNATATYTIGVTNNGPDTATNIVISDPNLVSAVSGGVYQVNSATATTGTYNGTNWSIPTLTSGSSATLTITVQVIGTNASNSVTTQASLVSLTQTDWNAANNASPNRVFTILWPVPRFVNIGTPGSCNNITWGAAPGGNAAWGIGSNQTWVRSQNYIAGSWGIGGTPTQPTDLNHTIRYPNGTIVNSTGDSATYNLFNCRAYSGSNFWYQFDGLAPGSYRLYLVFADPFNAPGQRYFDVQMRTGGVTTTLYNNFDISSQAGGQGNYVIRPPTITVASDGILRITFVGNQSGSFDPNAIVSGLGYIFLNP